MKRRLLSAFLAVMMVLTMAPMAFAADEGGTTGVAKIGDVEYPTLQAAVDAAVRYDVIVLQKDITENVTIPSTLYKVTIDLNGKRWSGGTDIDEDGKPTAHKDKAALTNYGSNTFIKDSVGTGVITRDDTGRKTDAIKNTSYYVIDNVKGFLKIEGGTICNDSDYITDNGGTDGSSVIRNGGVAGQSNPTLTIAGGHVYQDDFIAVKNDEYGTLWVTGGTVESKNSTAILNWKTATIKNSAQVNGVINTLTYNNTKGQTTIDGTATVNGKIAADKYDKNTTNAPAVLVKGGNLDIAWAIGNATVQVTGGTFTKQVPAAYYGDGYEQTEENGKYTITKENVAQVGNQKYTTMDEAFKAQTTSGKPIVLLRDYTTGSTFNSGDASRVVDLNNHTWTCTGKDANSAAFEINYPNAALTVKNGKIVSSQLVGLIPSAMGGTITYDNSSLTFENVEMTTTATSGIESNGMNTNDVVTLKNSTLNVPNGFGIYFPSSGAVTIEDSTITAKTMGVQVCAGNLNVKNSTITVTGNAVNKTENDGAIEDGAAISVVDRAGYKGLGKVNIESGKFTSIKAYKWDNSTKQETAFDNSKNVVAVSGGVFAQKFDNSYCATGMTVIDSKDTTYPWTVGTLPANTENKIDAATDTGDNAVNADAITNSEDKNAAQDAAKKVKFEEAVADKNEITETDKQRGLTALANENKVQVDSNGKIQGNTTVTIVKEVFLDIAVTDFKVQGLADKDVSVTMDITPKYNLIATTDKDNRTDANSVTLETKPLTVSEATKVSVTIPAFANKKVYIDHANGKNLYVATADANGKIEFTTNGFSPFTFALTNPGVVAEVNGNAYKSLQDAVNAVENNGTIEIVGGNKDYTATISGSSKTIKVKNSLTDEIKVTVNGESKTIKPSKDATFTYTKPSSGSSGGSSSGKTTYKVTTSAVNNGGVNASPSSAEKGAVITITLSPDKGYKLDKLTVTDGSGKSVSTVKKSDTVYTFTMPASAVKVGVSYVKATETPSVTKFNDVSANDWFASAVDYVTGKGMMNGTAANTFSPKANTTRGMLMTVLARHAGEDTTGGSVWYEKGMNWAKANGVSDGTNPQVNITREQLAAMLYRYAQNKKYDVSGAKSLDGYTDAQSVSSYAVPALQWANAAGVVTGKSGSKLDPKGYATRAEVAAMLMRFCENVEK